MKLLFVFMLTSVIFVSACQDDNADSHDAKSRDHVWKEQTDMLEKAKAVEGILKESAEDQRQQIQNEAE